MRNFFVVAVIAWIAALAYCVIPTGLFYLEDRILKVETRVQACGCEAEAR